MLHIEPLIEQIDIDTCARLMATSEPWITLGRGYDACLAVVSNPERELYGAREAGELIGFVLLDMHTSFRGYIQTLCVRPESRGRGVGTSLLTSAEEHILRTSPNIFLCVSSFNTAALRLYRRQGYAIVGELPDFLVAGHAEILMRKTIGSWQDFRPTLDYTGGT